MSRMAQAPGTVDSRAIWVRFLLYPGHTLPTAIAPALVAAGLALRDGIFAPLPLALAFVGSWLVHLAGVFADNHELLRRHQDVPEHPELLQALADGSLRLRDVRLAIFGCLGGALLTGIYPLLLGGVPALVLGLVGVAASLGYAAGPRPYAKSGLADVVFFVMFGIVAVAGCYYVQACAVHPGFGWRDLPLDAYIAGLPVGGLVTAVLVIDDIRDRSWDARKGWRTSAVRFGLRTSRVAWVTLVVAAHLALPWFWLARGHGIWVLLPWLSAPHAVAIGRAVCRFDTTHDLLAMTPRTAKLAMAFAGLQALGLALGGR